MDILQGLNREQAQAVQHMNGPLLILAGAGSGKTRVLTHRIAYLIQQGIKPYHILAVTFTNKAANEMKERVERICGAVGGDLTLGTFHSVCVRILRREIEKLGYKSSFVIYDSSDQLTVVKNILKELNIDSKQVNPKAVLSHISNAKNELMDAEKYSGQATGYFEHQVSKVYDKYQAKLKENNALDFDDLIMLTVRLLQENPMVKGYYQNKFRYILVDEYQDTNHAQYFLVNLLAESHRNICVVGDPDQSIYGFRGADIRNILDFEEDYADATVIKLEENYRSTKKILDAAHHVIIKNRGRKDKRLRSNKGDGENLNLFRASNDREEAQYVITQIMELRRRFDYNYSDFAILYRINAQSRVFEETLMKNRIPYKVVGGLKFYDRMEIKDVLAYLRLIYNPDDDVAFERIINRPRRGIGDTSLNRLMEFATERGMSLCEAAGKVKQIPEIRGKASTSFYTFYQMIEVFRSYKDDIKVTELTQKVLDQTGYLQELESEGTVEAQTRIENVKELFSVMEEYIRSGQGYTLGSFLEDVALASDLDQVDSSDGVLMMTIHTVKGLEYPVVFLTGLEESVFPHSRAFEDESELEEERRLCYVGITRAMERLYMSFAHSRMVFGQSKYNPPSRFIGDIPLELFGIEPERSFESDVEESLVRGSGSAPTPKLTSTGSKSVSPLYKAQSTATVNPSDDTVRYAQYAGGEKVRHPKWGIGTVVGVRGKGEKQELDIVFPTVGLKKVLLEYAPIERA